MLAVRNGARGENCTRTGGVLDAVPLLLGYAGMNMTGQAFGEAEGMRNP